MKMNLKVRRGEESQGRNKPGLFRPQRDKGLDPRLHFSTQSGMQALLFPSVVCGCDCLILPRICSDVRGSWSGGAPPT